VQALVLECVLDQEVCQSVRAKSDQAIVELASRRAVESLAAFLRLREPSEADCDAVLAEEAVAADRARARAHELTGRKSRGARGRRSSLALLHG
jgi:Arc/MetJ family transcription regulator